MDGERLKEVKLLCGWAVVRPINQSRPSQDSGPIILVTLSRPSPNRPKVYEFTSF